MDRSSEECHSYKKINGKGKSFVLIMLLKSLSPFWVMWKHSHSAILLRIIFMVYHSTVILIIYHWTLFLMIYQLTAWLDPPSIWLKAVNWKPPALQNALLPTHSLFSVTLVSGIAPLFGSQEIFITLRRSTIVRFWIGEKYALILSTGRRAWERRG